MVVECRRQLELVAALVRALADGTLNVGEQAKALKTAAARFSSIFSTQTLI